MWAWAQIFTHCSKDMFSTKDITLRCGYVYRYSHVAPEICKSPFSPAVQGTDKVSCCLFQSKTPSTTRAVPFYTLRKMWASTFDQKSHQRSVSCPRNRSLPGQGIPRGCLPFAGSHATHTSCCPVAWTPKLRWVASSASSSFLSFFFLSSSSFFLFSSSLFYLLFPFFFFFLRIWAPTVTTTTLLVHFLPMKCRTGHDVISTCATHAKLIHDVKGTHH